MKPRTAKHLLLLCILLAVIGQWIVRAPAANLDHRHSQPPAGRE